MWEKTVLYPVVVAWEAKISYDAQHLLFWRKDRTLTALEINEWKGKEVKTARKKWPKIDGECVWIAIVVLVVCIVVGYLIYYIIEDENHESSYGVIEGMVTCGDSVYFYTRRHDDESSSVIYGSRFYRWSQEDEAPEYLRYVTEKVRGVTCMGGSTVVLLLGKDDDATILRYDPVQDNLYGYFPANRTVESLVGLADGVVMTSDDYVLRYNDGKREPLHTPDHGRPDDPSAAQTAPIMAYTAAGHDEVRKVIVYNYRDNIFWYLDAGTSNPSVSPNGNRVAMTVGGRLWVFYVVNQGSLQSYLSVELGDIRGIVFSPDGEWVVFQAQPNQQVTQEPRAKDCQIYRLHVNSGSYQPVVDECFEEDIYAWLPDGSGLVYLVESTNGGTKPAVVYFQ